MTINILNGDCRDVLKGLAADSFDCVVTSPPYYGLRDYGVDGQIGLEPTLDAYVEQMAGVFEELRRVLKPSGTAWLNLGDSYAANRTYQVSPTKWPSLGQGQPSKVPDGLKPKDLCGVPWRVAFALQARGWWLRSAIVWHKPNPMPESTKDRPTSAYEMVFLLTKSSTYFYDADAIREPMAASSISRLSQDIDSQAGSTRANGATKTNGTMKAVARIDKQRGHGRRHDGFNDRWDAMSKDEQQANGANARNVWTIAPRPFKGSHFATMPPDLAERCIKAGCPAGGRVLDPFGGAGTTGLVADRLGRHATLIELNPAYAVMADERIHGSAPLLAAQ